MPPPETGRHRAPRAPANCSQRPKEVKRGPLWRRRCLRWQAVASREGGGDKGNEKGGRALSPSCRSLRGASKLRPLSGRERASLTLVAAPEWPFPVLSLGLPPVVEREKESFKLSTRQQILQHAADPCGSMLSWRCSMCATPRGSLCLHLSVRGASHGPAPVGRQLRSRPLPLPSTRRRAATRPSSKPRARGAWEKCTARTGRRDRPAAAPQSKREDRPTA